jgi:hypothetical protein
VIWTRNKRLLARDNRLLAGESSECSKRGKRGKRGRRGKQREAVRYSQ